MATSIAFHNGSTINVTYETDPVFYHYDIRDDAPYERGYGAYNLVYDEFAGVDLTYEYEEPRYNEWLIADRYELIVKDGHLDIKVKEAPDFGEFSPSQELETFVNDLFQG